MLFKTVLLWEQYIGRLQTSSEEKPCLSQIKCVGDVDVVFWRCSCLASFRFYRLLNGLQNGLSLLCSLFLVSFVLFLYGTVEEGFAKTCKLNQ